MALNPINYEKSRWARLLQNDEVAMAIIRELIRRVGGGVTLTQDLGTVDTIITNVSEVIDNTDSEAFHLMWAQIRRLELRIQELEALNEH